MSTTQPPDLIALDPDDYQARYVGHTAKGLQFFLTFPFSDQRRQFSALYLFDAEGQLLEARIHDRGTLVDANSVDEPELIFAHHLAEIGPVSYERINVQPFEIERFGISFGFVPRPPEEEDEDYWWVTVEPGDYMAFHEPWDSGAYDT